MGSLERWLRVGAYAVAFTAVFVLTQGWAWLVVGFRGAHAPRRVRDVNRIHRFWGTTLTELTIRLLHSRLDVEGRVPPGRHVVVSNHQSTADIAILIHVLRDLNCKYVAKSVLGRLTPVISTALRHGGGVVISRRARRRDVEALRAMARGLERWDGSAILFAEGSRSRDGLVRPYKAAAARVIARESGLPILPVALDGTWCAADLPGFARNMPGASVKVMIGPPIPFERWSVRPFDEVMEEVRGWAAAEIGRSRIEGVTPSPPGWHPGHTLLDPTETSS